ncbi:MAG: hypothetical protein U1F81_00890 [Verrucomicrobiaceae bacterium]
MLDAGEDGLHGVEVGLCDGIELMVVAFGATHRGGEEGGSGGVHHVGELVGTLHELQIFVLTLHAVHRPADDETGSYIRAAGIARDLLEHEAVEGFVSVEGVDDVVAVAPSIRALVVRFEAVRVSEADDIQPVAGPFFTVVAAV